MIQIMLYRMHLSITQDNIKIERPALTGLYFRSMAYHVIHGSDVTSNIIPYAE